MRRRQILGDLGAIAWIGLWVWIGLGLRELIGRLAESGRTLERAGDDLSGAGARIGERLQDLPIVGDALRAAFGSVAQTGQSLTEAGVAQQDVVAALALWLPLLIATLPIGYVVVPYVAWRARWMRNVEAAKRLRDEASGWPELFALRALTNRPLRQLRRADDDPHAAYAAGRYHPLAQVELRALGLKLPPR